MVLHPRHVETEVMGPHQTPNVAHRSSIDPYILQQLKGNGPNETPAFLAAATVVPFTKGQLSNTKGRLAHKVKQSTLPDIHVPADGNGGRYDPDYRCQPEVPAIIALAQLMIRNR